MTRPARRAIRLDIGTLALPGVTVQRAERIGGALRGELSRLLSTGAAAVQLRQAVEAGRLDRPVIDAGSLRIGHGERPERMGRRLAETIARGLLHPGAGNREAERVNAGVVAKALSEVAAERPPVSVAPASSRVLRLQRKCACGGESGLTGECESCARHKLQRRGDGSHGHGIPASVGHVLSQPGRPLDAGARSLMEGRFGEDFSAVRIHDHPAASRSAHDVQALAYTVGQDIVFAAGQYQPHSESGQHLLAHELAHTAQQKGLQRSGTFSLADQGPEYRRLEEEADRAADAVMRGRTGGTLGVASTPTLSRATTNPPPQQSIAATGPETDIRIQTSDLQQMDFKVSPAGAASATAGGPEQRRFVVDKFYLPGQKGERAFEIYNRFASGRQLQATLQIEGTHAQRTAQWQVRDRTEVLGDSWVGSVRWTPADRDANWAAQSGGNQFPRAAAGVCNIDHIVELQLSGGNDPANLQALDATPNQFSGRAIWQEVRTLGTEIAQRFSVAPGSQVQVNFGSVEVKGAFEPRTGATGAARSCLMIDHAARAGVEARAVTDAAGAARRSVRLETQASGNDFVIPTDWGTGNRSVSLAGESANAASIQMISGFVFEGLTYRTANAATVSARFDPRDRTRLPITVTGERGNLIDLAGARGQGTGGVAYRLTLSDRTTNIPFTYPYLSPGVITRLGTTPTGDLRFNGYITPTVPFLPRRMNVVYDNDGFRISAELNRNQLRSPLPGFRLTSASLTLALAPALSAGGDLGFAIGSEARPLADGTVRIGADANGLTGTGRISARIPGVDTADIIVNYVNGAWSGQLVIESSQIRLPNVQRGRLQLDIDATGLRPSGELSLLLPRNLGEATLGFTRQGQRFVFTGNGRLRVPGLDEVDITARYDGVNLHAGARNIRFRWRGMAGTIDVAYDARGDGPGRITGTGQLTLARGDVTGNVEVRLHDSGRFSGRGRVSYPFTIRGQRIEAAAGVIVNEDQSVRVEGALRFPQPIELFRRFGDNRRLFYFQRSIPIPGLSIGPVGVVAVIEGGVSARYGFGPGQLRNVELEAAFNPLAEQINPDVAFRAELNIGAEAGIAGTIGGGLGVEAGVARVQGTLTVTADLGLNAVLGGRLDLRYAARKFNLTARPGINAALNLGLALDARARAEAGFGPFTIGTEKTWNLGRRNIILGSFSMYAPIGWSSDGGFTAPTMDQIEWGPIPDIDPADLLAQLFRSSSAQEREQS